MAPKKKDENKEKKGATIMGFKYVPTQAIIVCDWVVGQEFLPLDITCGGGVLTPVCGVPLLSYFLIFLRDQRVRDVILLIRSNGAALENYVKEWRKDHYTGKLKIQVCEMPEETVGNALRNIQQKSLIQEDFFFLTPRTIIDDIGDAVEEHSLRREKDPNAIITKIFKKVDTGHAATRPFDRLAVLYSDENEILSIGKSSEKVIPAQNATKDFYKKGGSLRLEFDLCDCNVDICAPEVLDVYSEHFDFQNPTDESFARLLLDAKYEDELSSQSTFAFFLPSQYYMHPVDCPRSLHAASMEICKGRKAKNPTLFESVFQEIPKDKGVTILPHQSCVTGEATAIEGDVKCTFISSNCRTNKSATVLRSILFDNVIVEEDAEIEDSVIGPNVTIKSGSVVPLGCIIGPNITIEADDDILPHARVFADADAVFTPPPRADRASAGSNDKKEAAVKSNNMNESTSSTKNGKEPAVQDELKSAEFEGDAYSAMGSMSEKEAAPLPILKLRPKMTPVQLASESIGFNINQWPEWLEERKALEQAEKENNEDKEEDIDSDLDEFSREIRTMLRSLVSSDFTDEDVESTLVEIKSLRMGSARSCADTIKAILPFMLDIFLNVVSLPDAKLGPEVDRWSPVVKAFKMKSNTESERELINGLAEFSRRHPSLGSKKFSFIVQKLYQNDVFGDDVILEWYNKSLESVSQVHEYVDEIKPFVTWIQQSDESGSDDDKDSD